MAIENMTEEEIREGVLKEFEKLAAIPRPSGHEKGVSDFLKGYLAELGFSVTQDSVNNIIADVPATKGSEGAPRTVLQGHMDMVCVAAHGVMYRPTTDPIRLKRTAEYLMAEGTSLGADDGIGVAEAIFLAKNSESHGPLRIIFTVDEERGMEGAINLEAKHLEDVAYLINCDSENYDELTVGSAGSVDLVFHRKLKRAPVTLPRVYALSVKGLKGGHSGERIGDGRGNAIQALASALRALQEKGQVELVEFAGGTARNAIPSTAKAVFATSLPAEEIQAVLKEEESRFLAKYGNAETGIDFGLEERETEKEKDALIAGDAMRLLRLVGILHSGTYAMSTVIPGLVETSANLGVVTMEGDDVEVAFFPRSSVDAKVDDFRRYAKDVADLTGFSLEVGTQSPGWKENKSSQLAKIMTEVFRKQNGKPMKVASIHAGLECGWHLRKNPNLDMVSIGVTTLDIHSPKEHLLLSTIAPQVRLIDEALRRISTQKA